MFASPALVNRRHFTKLSRRQIDDVDSKRELNLLYILQHYFPTRGSVQILQPNSMWTAGCCVYTSSRTHTTTAKSIAVMGNNDMRSHCTLTRALHLTTLETMIVAPGATPADIFPGFATCRTNSDSHNL